MIESVFGYSSESHRQHELQQQQQHKKYENDIKTNIVINICNKANLIFQCLGKQKSLNFYNFIKKIIF